MPDHAARTWVDKNFPGTPTPLRAMLILAYGAGLDAGLTEAQKIVRQELENAPRKSPESPENASENGGDLGSIYPGLSGTFRSTFLRYPGP